MYSAATIAQFIINYCMRYGSAVTNLKLQKLLYYVWIDFYKETEEYLFADEICAWPLGPVIPDVYDIYCVYGGIQIRTTFEDVAIEPEHTAALSRILSGYLPISARDLVDMSHEEGKPWSKIFKHGQGNRKPIPYTLIIQDECNYAGE